MVKSSYIALATFGSVGIAAIISIVWFAMSAGESKFEPMVGLLGLVGGLAGILAERRTASQERRRIALITLTDELQRATRVLADERFAPPDGTIPKPTVYPRLPTSAGEAALISGALSDPRDTHLLNRLHQWRDEANEFNHRLELTEMRIFGSGATDEVPDFDHELHSTDGHLAHVRQSLRELRAYLEKNHPTRSRDGQLRVR